MIGTYMILPRSIEKIDILYWIAQIQLLIKIQKASSNFNLWANNDLFTSMKQKEK